MRREILICAVALAAWPAVADATPGDLDPAFSRDGFVKARFDEPVGSAQVAVDAADRIVVATSFAGGNFNRPAGFTLRRYLPNGSLDSDFASGGGLTTIFEADGSRVEDLITLADGRVLVAGRIGGDLAVARLLAGGEPDPAFSGDGLATVDLGAEETATGIAVQSDGAVVVSMTVEPDSSTPGFGVVRLTTGGAPDPSFSGDGVDVAQDPVSLPERAETVAIGPDGLIYVGGSGDGSGFSNPENGVIARYLQNGELDPSFAFAGIMTHDTGYAESVQGIGFDAEGRVVYVSRRSPFAPFAARLTPDGFVDTTLGDGGPVTGRNITSGGGFAIDSGGRALISGATPSGRFGGPIDFATNRFRAGLDGLDDTWGGDGSTVTDYRQRDEFASDLALTTDGRVVLSGGPDFPFGNILLLARLEVADGEPDLDADGVVDSRDDCPERFAKRADGCPKLKRTLSLAIDADADLFSGRLRSQEAKCVSRLTVSVRRHRRGADERLAKVKTSNNGRWEIEAVARRGRYYAFSKRVVYPRLGSCKKARSPAITIR